jgi:hypothetical protein
VAVLGQFKAGKRRSQYPCRRHLLL